MTDFRERIIAEMEDLDDTALQEVYEIVHRLNQQTQVREDLPLLERLSKIHIQGPKDFSENIDHYLNHNAGEA